MKNELQSFGNTFIKNGKILNKVNLIPNNANENPLFGLLFFANFHPYYNKIIEKLINFYKEINSVKTKFELIYCSCDDNEKEFEASISEGKLDKIPWLIIPFDKEPSNQSEKEFEKIRKNLIDNYSVASLPRLIILDKEGKKVDSLGIEMIMSIDDNYFNGWVNQSNLSKIMIKNNKVSLGDKAISICHQHQLTYADETLKMPEYKGGNWNCDECGKSFKSTVPNFYCAVCGYDICDACYEKNK